MNWLQLGGSIVAIVVLAGIARALGLGGGVIDDGAAAMRIADEALSGFEAERAVVGRDGRSALVYGSAAQVAAIKLHGAHPAVRLVRAGAVVETAEEWVVDSGERLFGRVTVKK